MWKEKKKQTKKKQIEASPQLSLLLNQVSLGFVLLKFVGPVCAKRQHIDARCSTDTHFWLHL